jgi:transposase InsO family protein
VISRCLRLSRSGNYDWPGRPLSARKAADKTLIATITEIHAMSRYSYGAPRVHAELRLGLGVRCGRKRVARLMRTAGIAGICHRRKRRGHQALPACHDDLVQRRFVADRPNTLWVTDITEHLTSEGHGVLLRGARCVLADDRGLVNRRPQAHRPGRRRPADGVLATATSGTICHSDRDNQTRFKWSSQHSLVQSTLASR